MIRHLGLLMMNCDQKPEDRGRECFAVRSGDASSSADLCCRGEVCRHGVEVS